MSIAQPIRLKNIVIERCFIIGFLIVMISFTLFIFTVLASDILFTKLPFVRKILLDNATLHSIYLSLMTSTIATALAMIVAVPSGYLLSRYHFRGKNIIDLIIKLPITLPPLIAGVSLLIIFSSPLGQFFENIGIKFVFTVQGIILAQFFISASFAIITMKATFNEIDPGDELVARTLGCNKWQAFWRITIPEARFGLAGAIVLTWSRAVGEFVPIMIFCGAMVGKTDILPIAIFLKVETGRLEEAMALTVVFLAICLLILPVANLLTAKSGMKNEMQNK